MTPRPGQRELFGHPVGLFILCGTELWERFSFYGMQALLVLYMVHSLLEPEHADQVLGLGALRHALEGVTGPLSTQAFASQLFGLYAGLAYLTPPFGGALGDRLLGSGRTVILGAVLMAVGHLLMASDRYFLIALGLLIVGCGCLKGNITAQVGRLYEEGDPRRVRAFAIFNMGVNAGGLLGPFLCGAAGELYGWHYGFALAGIMMLVALVTYAVGWRWLPPEQSAMVVEKRPIDAAGRRRIGGVVSVLLIGLLFSIPYYQLANAWPIFLHDSVDRSLLGRTVPVTWLMAIDSAFVILGTPIVAGLWRYQTRRGREPDDLGKILVACIIATAAFLILALASSRGEPVPMSYGLVFSAMLGIAFVYQWPTTLALVSRLAPPSLNSTLMGCAFLVMFVSYTAVGWIGSMYERMPHAHFWILQATISACGYLVLCLLRRPLSRLLALDPATTETIA